jgi:hypothetical protein
MEKKIGVLVGVALLVLAIAGYSYAVGYAAGNKDDGLVSDKWIAESWKKDALACEKREEGAVTEALRAKVKELQEKVDRDYAELVEDGCTDRGGHWVVEGYSIDPETFLPDEATALSCEGMREE